jgi:15-cis-phytoene synthase
MDATDDLDDRVRQADLDRWLASRFIADPAARADVVALYALNIELAHIAEAVREPLMGEIRLTWWREAIEALFDGGAPRRHPVVEALALAIARRDLPRAPFEAMIEARFADLADETFADLDAIETYLDGTAGALMGLAAAALGAAAAPAVQPAARAWGLAGLARLRRLPGTMEGQVLRARVDERLAAARAAAASLPVAAFPALAYACLARPYAAGRALSDLEKRARLTIAVLRGRL